MQLVCDLVRKCDVVVENFAPGVIARMGMGYDTLRKFKPDLVMLSISGYGQFGPYRDYVSLGQQTAARAGMFWTTGYPNDVPRQIGVSYADPVAGVFGAFAIISALLRRDRTGQGQYIDLSMWETLEMMLAESVIEYEMTGRQPERMGNHDNWIAPHEAYKALGDAEQWVTIAVPNRAMAPAVRSDRSAGTGRGPAVSHRRTAQTQRGCARRDHQRLDAYARAMGDHRDFATRRSGGVSHP